MTISIVPLPLHRELNHQFRASVRDLCQRYLAEETCPVGGILLLKATTRTNLDAHLEPMGVRVL